MSRPLGSLSVCSCATQRPYWERSRITVYTHFSVSPKTQWEQICFSRLHCSNSSLFRLMCSVTKPAYESCVLRHRRSNCCSKHRERDELDSDLENWLHPINCCICCVVCLCMTFDHVFMWFCLCSPECDGGGDSECLQTSMPEAQLQTNP